MSTGNLSCVRQLRNYDEARVVYTESGLGGPGAVLTRCSPRSPRVVTPDCAGFRGTMRALVLFCVEGVI